MNVTEVTRESFENEVLKADKPVLVDFNAAWCGPCQMLKPILDEFAGENGDIKVVSVNTDEEDILAEDYDVSSIPCLVLFKNGAEDKRAVGFRNKEQLKEFVGG